MTAQQLPRNEDGTLAAWAWPGGYPLYYLDHSDCVLCPTCANANQTAERAFQPIAADVNWEDPELYC